MAPGMLAMHVRMISVLTIPLNIFIVLAIILTIINSIYPKLMGNILFIIEIRSFYNTKFVLSCLSQHVPRLTQIY